MGEYGRCFSLAQLLSQTTIADAATLSTSRRRCRRMAKRAVLAFSGGLDTSAILTWMVKEQGWEVVTFTANLGQRASDSLAVAAEKAKDIGAVAHVAVDLRRELLEEFFVPAMQAHAKLE